VILRAFTGPAHRPTAAVLLGPRWAFPEHATAYVAGERPVGHRARHMIGARLLAQPGVSSDQ
jgi:hypothetical protein